MYGNIGQDDPQVIDGYLAKVPAKGTVLNLGCGPNIMGDLNRLAAAVARCRFDSTLILADIQTSALQGQTWIPGPRKVQVQEANAGHLTAGLGLECIDLILAFGLFGALSVSTLPQKTGPETWPTVLAECYGTLKRGGHLIASNSVHRQPLSAFEPAVVSAGFSLIQTHESPSIHLPDKPDERRYLAICQKE